MRRPNRFRRHTIPPEGLVLDPNRLYLGRTIERTETHNLVPMLEDRSSIGRLGLFVHVTAGFGDVGFCGYWTLEMFAVQPVRIYPGVRILSDFLSHHRGSGDRVLQRKVSEQPRYPAEPVIQRAGIARGPPMHWPSARNGPSESAAAKDRQRRPDRRRSGGSRRRDCPQPPLRWLVSPRRRAEDGRIPKRYPLEETASPSYASRTIQNVIDSDGTLVLTVGTIRGGTLMTKNAAQKRKKPHLVVDLKQPAEIKAVVDWMKDNEIRVLNVAGPRASQAPEAYDLAVRFLLKLLSTREKPKRRVRSKKA